MVRGAACSLAVLGLSWGAGAQQSGVVQSPHNLSASGPGHTRALSEQEVCIFCHAPHNASPVRPLWNRTMPLDSYTIYASRALDATPGQPTGTSKMCLSCHDGTIALGAVVSRAGPIAMSGGVQTLTTSPSMIGTDLSDDHPVSFRYDSSLASRDPHIRPPSTLPAEIKLDSGGELQCTACHDAHNNFHGNFLVMQNTHSELCLSCHDVGRTTVPGHAECAACHQSHTSPSGPYLLREATITRTCGRCHDGTVHGASDVMAELRMFSAHDTESPVDPPGSVEDHTTCTDCHEPHTMGAGTSRAPSVQPNLGAIDGVNASGSKVTPATYEFEVCFKCHADLNPVPPMIRRQLAQSNMRLELSPSAVSYHPVEVAGRNTDMPSLLPPWTSASIIHCSECHSAEAGGVADGSGASGTHGSAFPGLLNARYETYDETSESASAYALCYRCHDRTNILSESGSSFPGHRKHVLENRTPCSACHDAHGIASTQGNQVNNSHLINFDTFIVRPNSKGRMEFRDLGRFRGECFLSCHGKDHDPLTYERGR